VKNRTVGRDHVASDVKHSQRGRLLDDSAEELAGDVSEGVVLQIHEQQAVQIAALDLQKRLREHGGGREFRFRIRNSQFLGEDFVASGHRESSVASSFLVITALVLPLLCPFSGHTLQSTREETNDSVTGLIVNLRVREFDLKTSYHLIPPPLSSLPLLFTEMMQCCGRQLLCHSSELRHEPSQLLALQTMKPLGMSGRGGVVSLEIGRILSLELL
jgi:hypothetical protein